MPGNPGQKQRQWWLGTKWESRALVSALCRSGLLTCARVSPAETWKFLVAGMCLHAWGSRGRRFKSGRPDQLCHGFRHLCIASNCGARRQVATISRRCARQHPGVRQNRKAVAHHHLRAGVPHPGHARRHRNTQLIEHGCVRPTQRVPADPSVACPNGRGLKIPGLDFCVSICAAPCAILLPRCHSLRRVISPRRGEPA